jgi:hypothetical protein
MSGEAPVDLTGAVTVFVPTIGAPTFPRCLAHLRAQDCLFRLEVIADVTPLAAALQRMLDTCATPYFVQVDEDMLLSPRAIRTLHEWIRDAAPTVALCVGELWDEHLGRPIEGVKIARLAIVRRYRWDAGTSIFSRNRQLLADGFTIARRPPGPPDTLGLHAPHWTALSLYERYYTLERWRRANPDDLAWFEPYGEIFLRRFRERPSRETFFALMGILSGALGPAEVPASKDATAYETLPGLRALREYWRSMTGDADPA